MKCLNCSAEIPDDAAFCGECGKPITKEKSAKRCPDCGSEIPSGARVCSKCGFKFPSKSKGKEVKRESQGKKEKPSKKTAGQKPGPKPESAGLPKWILPAAAALVALLSIAAFFFFASQDTGEPVFVPWHCEEEHVSAGSEIAVYYYWTAVEKEQIGDYFSAVEYQVTVNDVPASIKADGFGEIEQDEEGFFKQMYWMNLGNLDPGEYQINTFVDIKEPVFDGWDWFGPDTEMPVFNRSCTVIVADMAQ